MLITAEMKDIVLRHIVENCELGKTVRICYADGIDNIYDGNLLAILEQLDDNKLVRVKAANTVAIVWVKIKAHDFIQRGGFYGFEILFQSKVEKLLIELEKLQAESPTPKNLEAVQAISSAVQGVGALYQMIIN